MNITKQIFMLYFPKVVSITYKSKEKAKVTPPPLHPVY